MKITAFILLSYLLFVSAIPCCSFDNCSDEKTAQATHPNNEDNECGTCSPFFSCDGCAGFAISAKELDHTMITLFPKPLYIEYLVSFPPDIQYDFWRPPQLV